MGRRCAAPGCGTGNPGVEKKRIGPKPNVFSFPDDPIMREKWIRKTRREDLTEKKIESLGLCLDHFYESDLETVKVDQRGSRGKDLVRKRLKFDAVPSKWPNCPSYLTTPEIKPRETCKSMITHKIRLSEKKGTRY